MKPRTLALLCVWTLPSAILLAATALMYSVFRIPPPDRLDAAARTAILAQLRAAVDAADAPLAGGLARPLTRPLFVTLWSQGRAFLRIEASGDDLAAATADAAAQLRGHRALASLAATERAAARLQVDIVTATGPLAAAGGLLNGIAVPGIVDMLAVNPGVDGIAGTIGDSLERGPEWLLPHELVAAKLLAGKRPSPAMPDLAIGIDLAKAGEVLAARAGLSPRLPRRLFRFRTDTFIEPADRNGLPLPLYRQIPPAPPLSAAALRDAALAGGRYLVAHLSPNGRYIYEHDLATGIASDPERRGGYNMPRHAGTTYFLAELYRITKQPWLREPIERAFAHLAELLSRGACAGTLPDGTPFDCVADRGEPIAGLGATALTVVALAEYQRATGDPRYLPLATKLAAWLLYMQRADGSFRHRYDLRDRKPDEAAQLLYYSGEAALALARMHVVTGERRYADAAGRALDWLVGWYDFFLGGFFYGEEHWTCIAAEALWPAVKREAYMTFCHGYAQFLRGQQATRSGRDQDDYAGAYNLTPFIPPNNTPAGSRTEAVISAYLLGRHHGAPDPEIAAQIRAALVYALGQQVRADSNYSAIGAADGAVPGSPIDRNVRIDFVQHVCSAMIRASEWPDWVDAQGN